MEEDKRVINVNPLSKWKRFLMFLGDFGITFILAFTIFNLVSYPLAKIIMTSDKDVDKVDNLSNEATKMLIDSKIIFEDKSSYDLENHVHYTFKVFLSYYAFDELEPDINNPQYGHKEENEVIRHYFVDIKNDENAYYDNFIAVNEKDEMFIIDKEAKSIMMKTEYRELLSLELLEKEEADYSTLMTNFRDNVFSQLFFKYVYIDIQNNDFVKDGVSYNGLLSQISKIQKKLQWIASITAIITTILCWSAVYLIYPLINEEKRTPTMSIMRISKLDFRRMMTVTRGKVILESFYYLIYTLGFSIFLPSVYFGVAYCFNLPMLFVISVVSFSLMLVSLIFMLFNQYNRSITDFIVSNVLLPTSELDALYRSDDSGQDGKE